MMISTLAFLLATAGSALAGPAPSPAAAAAPAAASASTSTASAFGVSTQTVSSIYTGDRSRDPFMPAAMGAKSARRVTDENKPEGPEVVDIHGMQLKGILKDTKIDFALFSSEAGGTYLLRGGKLFNERNKQVPGITGNIKIKQKTVELITADKDVQVFRLGEDDKDNENR